MSEQVILDDIIDARNIVPYPRVVITKPNLPTKSFKVTVELEDIDGFLIYSICPENSRVRRFSTGTPEMRTFRINEGFEQSVV